MLFLLLVVFLLQSPGFEGLPIAERVGPPPPSALATHATARSVHDIIWGCATTTFLCAWVSMHPNTNPPTLRKGWERVGQNVRFLILMMIIPEIVVGWAWIERKSAEKIKHDFEEKDINISMTHAHLIEMGGFALCIPVTKLKGFLSTSAKVEGLSFDIKNDSLLYLRYVQTLSAKRLQELVNKQAVEFPWIFKSEIEDRSKSDGLARFITAIQVLWFVVQCIGRAANRLAITELELTTLALASLNAYMLWLWRDKPQNIEIQVPVYYLEDIEKWEAELNEKEEERANEAEWKRDEAEGITMTMKSEQDEKKEEWEGATVKGGEEMKMRMSKTHRTRTGNWEKQVADWQMHKTEWKKRIEGWEPEQDGWFRSMFTVERWKSLWHGFLGQEPDYSDSSQKVGVGHILIPALGLLCDTSLFVFRSWIFIPIVPFWIVAVGISLASFLFLLSLSPVLFLLFKSRRIRCLFKTYLDQRDGVPDNWDIRGSAMQAAFIGIVFGGLHCIGWNFPFPTTAERWTWRVMSLVLTIIPSIPIFNTSLLCMYATIDECIAALTCSRPTTRDPFLTSHLLIATISIYAIARICILMLAFTSLRDQPSSAYIAVSWTQLFPHPSS